MITEKNLRLLNESNLSISHDEYKELKRNQADAVAKRNVRAKVLSKNLRDISDYQTQRLIRVLNNKFVGQKYDGNIIKNFYADNDGGIYYNTDKTNNKGGEDYSRYHEIEIYDRDDNPSKDPIGSFIYKWKNLHAGSYYENNRRYDSEKFKKLDKRYDKLAKKYGNINSIPKNHTPKYNSVEGRYKRVLGEEVIEENELSRAKAEVELSEIDKKLKEKGWSINPYMNIRENHPRTKANELLVTEKGACKERTFVLDVNTGKMTLKEPIDVSRDKELMVLFKKVRHLCQKNEGQGPYRRGLDTHQISSREIKTSSKYIRKDGSNPLGDISWNRDRSNQIAANESKAYIIRNRKKLNEDFLEEDFKNAQEN